MQIKRYWDKKIISSLKYCNVISKYYDFSIQTLVSIDKNKYFQFTPWKKIASKMSFYLSIAILCAEMSRVNKALRIPSSESNHSVASITSTSVQVCCRDESSPSPTVSPTGDESKNKRDRFTN